MSKKTKTKSQEGQDALSSYRTSSTSVESAWSDLLNFSRSYNGSEHRQSSPDLSQETEDFWPPSPSPTGDGDKSNAGLSAPTEAQKEPVADDDDVLEVLFIAIKKCNERRKRKRRAGPVASTSTGPVEVHDISPSPPRKDNDTDDVKIVEVKEGSASGKRKHSDDSNESNKKSQTLENSWDCPICYESLSGRSVMSTFCGHVFCKPCISSVLKRGKQCPTCRAKLSNKKVHNLFLFAEK